MINSVVPRISVSTFSLDRVKKEVTGMLKEKTDRRRTLRREPTESLAQVIFSLEEPWRSRFLVWLSERADGECGSRLPSQRQVAAWLDDADVSREVAVLLNRWLGKTL